MTADELMQYAQANKEAEEAAAAKAAAEAAEAPALENVGVTIDAEGLKSAIAPFVEQMQETLKQFSAVAATLTAQSQQIEALETQVKELTGEQPRAFGSSRPSQDESNVTRTETAPADESAAHKEAIAATNPAAGQYYDMANTLVSGMMPGNGTRPPIQSHWLNNGQ